jgi:hypothetical protein
MAIETIKTVVSLKIQKTNIVKIVFRKPPKVTTPSRPETKMLIQPVVFSIFWVRPEVAFLIFHEIVEKSLQKGGVQ